MNQAAVSAALSIIVGIFAGVFYDVIRFLRLLLGFDVRSPFKNGGGKTLGYIFVCLSDFLFFAVLSAAMCVFFFLTGDGRMRGYGLFGAGVGFLLYYNTVGRLFISVSSFLVSLFKRALRRLITLAATPFLYLALGAKKIVLHFLGLPIVTRCVKRYNDYINIMKKKSVSRARRRRMKRGDYVQNGGAYGEKGK